MPQDYSALYRVAPIDLSVPKTDFYTPLAGIANQITQNRQLAQNEELRKQALQQQADQQAAANANRQASLALQAQSLAESARHNQAAESVAQAASARAESLANRPDIKFMTDPVTGQTRIFQVPVGGVPRDITSEVGITQTQPMNPYSTGKMSEAQNKDALYAARMMNAENVLSEPPVVEAAQSRTQRGLGSVPIFGGSLVSSDYQRYDQAQRDFVNATLRRESGAAIAQSEFENANKQYFPQPGDGPAVIRQKAINRAEAIKGFAAGAGPNWKPPFIFDESSGKLVRNENYKAPVAQQNTQSAPQSTTLPEGATATNPTTGQKIQFRGGQWVPAQ